LVRDSEVLLWEVLIARTDVRERKYVDYKWERERAYRIEINEREVCVSSTYV
jgi:hypothetical protein